MIAKFAGLYPHVKHVLCCSIIIIHVAVRPSFQLSQSLSLSLSAPDYVCLQCLLCIVHSEHIHVHCISEKMQVKLFMCNFVSMLRCCLYLCGFCCTEAVSLWSCSNVQHIQQICHYHHQKLREFKRFRLSIRPSQCLNPLRSCALYSFLSCIFAVYFRSFFFLWIDFASTASPVSDNYVLWHYFGTFLNFRLGFLFVVVVVWGTYIFVCLLLIITHIIMAMQRHNYVQFPSGRWS